MSIFFITAILFLKSLAQNDSPIEIEYAKRTYKLLSSNQEHTPKNPEIEVLLIIKLKGISFDEFDKVDNDDIYVKAKEKHYNPEITIKQYIMGEGENLSICIVVPKNVLEFTFFLGNYPPISFKAEEKIHDELKT